MGYISLSHTPLATSLSYESRIQGYGKQLPLLCYKSCCAEWGDLRPWGLCLAILRSVPEAPRLNARKEFKERQDGGWTVQVKGLLRREYTLELWEWESSRESHTWSLNLYLISTVDNEGLGYLLFKEEISLGAGFHPFSSLLGQGLWPYLSWICLVWSGFLWPCLWHAARATADFPDNRPWFSLCTSPGILWKPN